MTNLKTSFIFTVLCFLGIGLNAQITDYQFIRHIKGVQDTWHAITLPPEFYAKVQKSLEDIRVYGITGRGDTVEAPYLIETHDWERKMEEVPFEIINKSSKRGSAYYSFVMEEPTIINQIHFDFENENFDWKINLEGSNDQKEWFSVEKDHRVLSIHNDHISYAYTTVKFTESQYKYWRAEVKGKGLPRLKGASLRKLAVEDGLFRTHPITKFNVQENKEAKETIIEIDLLDEVPVSYVQLQVKDQFDYYRPLEIDYRTRTKAQKPIYNKLTTSLLSSFEDHNFLFSSIITNGIRCVIENADNQPLNIESAMVVGPKQTLKIRFTEDAKYYLAYGNPNAEKPNYDLVNFKDKIPTDIKPVELGKETEIARSPFVKKKPLFISQTWLWVVLSIMVIVIGVFGYRLINHH